MMQCQKTIRHCCDAILIEVNQALFGGLAINCIKTQLSLRPCHPCRPTPNLHCTAQLPVFLRRCFACRVELVANGHVRLGYTALAITDECSVAGSGARPPGSETMRPEPDHRLGSPSRSAALTRLRHRNWCCWPPIAKVTATSPS